MGTPSFPYFNDRITHIEFVPDKASSVTGTVRTMVQFGADPAVIREEVEKIIAERDEKQRITKTLKGVAELAKMSQKPRRFVLAFHRSGEARTSSGVLFPSGRIYLEPAVRDADRGILPLTVVGTTESLEKLKKNLEATDISYHIEFID